MVHPLGGALVVDGWTCVAWEGVKILLTSRVLEVREVGARRLDAPTREVARCENRKKEFKPLLTFMSQRFVR
jgi:hypothetical protein